MINMVEKKRPLLYRMLKISFYMGIVSGGIDLLVGEPRVLLDSYASGLIFVALFLLSEVLLNKLSDGKKFLLLFTSWYLIRWLVHWLHLDLITFSYVTFILFLAGEGLLLLGLRQYYRVKNIW